MAQASAEKLEHTGPAEKERVATARAVGKYTKAAFAKRKKNRTVSPEYHIMRGERVNVSENRTLTGERGEVRVDSTVKEGRFQECGGGQTRRASLRDIGRKHDQVSGRKSSPGRSAKYWFHSKSGQT